MVLHLRVVEIIEQESGALFDHDGVVSPVKGLRGLKSNLMFDVRRREKVAAHEDELEKDLLQLLCVGVDYLVFLESF